MGGHVRRRRRGRAHLPHHLDLDWLTVAGVKPWDGRYEFDLNGRELTTREWGWIKRHSGYLPLTIDEGFNGADPELFACFAAHRAAPRRQDPVDGGPRGFRTDQRRPRSEPPSGSKATATSRQR